MNVRMPAPAKIPAGKIFLNFSGNRSNQSLSKSSIATKLS
jgi:hypothetical protein